MVRIGGEDVPQETEDVYYLAMAETNMPVEDKAIDLIAMANQSADEPQKQELKVVKENDAVASDNKVARTSDLASRMLSTKKQLEEKTSTNKNNETETDWAYEW